MSKKFIIEGHRGVQSLYPENTLPSFQAAIELGVDFIELDLLASLDGEIVIHHDYKIDGRLVHSLPLEDLKKVDCGSFHNREFPLQTLCPGAKIPLLKELFDMVKTSSHPQGKKICFNLEIKSDPIHPEYTLTIDNLAEKIMGIVKEYGLEERVYYSAFNPEVLMAIKKKDPKSRVALIYFAIIPPLSLKEEGWIASLLDTCAKVDAQIVSPHESLLNSEVVAILKKSQLQVIPWTVNDSSRVEELREIGADGIITDYPQNFIRLI